MKQFVSKFIQFLLFLAVVTVGAVVFFRVLIDRNIDLTLNQETQSVVIVGDSQIEAALNDEVIQSSVNISNPAEPVYFMYVKINKIIKEGNRPKAVILGFAPHNLFRNRFDQVAKMKTKLSNYFFMVEIPDMADLFRYNLEGSTKGLVASVFYSLRRKSLRARTSIENSGIGGFKPYPVREDVTVKEDVLGKAGYGPLTPDTMTIKYFGKLVDLCKTMDVTLIVLNTPVHETLWRSRTEYKAVYDEVVKEHIDEIVLWDLDSVPTADDLFSDRNHLNANGAILFSELIDRKLDTLLGATQ